MREIDDTHDAENQRQADSQECVSATQDQRIDKMLKKFVHARPVGRSLSCEEPPCCGDSAPQLERGASEEVNLRRLHARSDFRNDDFAVLDLDQIHGRNTLTAFLAVGPGLDELNFSVQPGDIELPKRRTNGFRIGLTGLLDGGCDSTDAVLAT